MKTSCHRANHTGRPLAARSRRMDDTALAELVGLFGLEGKVSPDSLAEWIAIQFEEPRDALLPAFQSQAHAAFWALGHVKRTGLALPQDAYTVFHRGFDEFFCVLDASDAPATPEELAALGTRLATATELVSGFELQPLGMTLRPAVREAIQNVVPSDAVDARTLAYELEWALHVYACLVTAVDCGNLLVARWRECYQAKCKTAITWLRQCPECALATAIKQQPRAAQLVPFTTRDVLFASQRAEIRTAIEQEIRASKEHFDAENDYSDINSDFECPACHSFQTRSYSLQMNSGDEAMSELWHCFACGKSGKA